jgi:hypothetical protein
MPAAGPPGPVRPYRGGIDHLSSAPSDRAGAGALRFARYALPPNSLGYCGPDDTGALFEQAVVLAAPPVAAPPTAAPPTAAPPTAPGPVRRAGAEVVSGLRSLAEGFEGAWPYLELISSANGLADPLDDDVVSAYWLGGPLLDRLGALDAGNHVDARFRARAGHWWAEVAAALEPGALLSHAFHVLVVGPWVGMMRTGRVEAPLQVMDRCRVRWGVVRAVDGDAAVVDCAPLEFGAGKLRLGVPAPETVRLGDGGHHPCGPVAVGDTVSLHWDWVCEVLSEPEQRRLRAYFGAAVQAANRALAVPGATDLG